MWRLQCLPTSFWERCALRYLPPSTGSAPELEPGPIPSPNRLVLYIRVYHLTIVTATGTVSGRGGPPVQPQLGLAPQRAPYSPSVMMPPPAASTTYPSSGYGQYPTVQAPRTSLPNCKNSGCSKPVHLDPTYGPFEYCSPMCRDAQLLQSERDKLKKDIESMTSSQSPQTPSASGGSYPPLLSATPLVPSRTSFQPQRSDHLARVTVKKACDEDIGIIVKRSLEFSPSVDKAAVCLFLMLKD